MKVYYCKITDLFSSPDQKLNQSINMSPFYDSHGFLQTEWRFEDSDFDQKLDFEAGDVIMLPIPTFNKYRFIVNDVNKILNLG